jgi:hypothetical protein
MKIVLPGRKLSFALLLTCIFCVGSAAAQDCTATTDADLVKAITDRIQTDRVLGPQISHIVVGSVNRFVKLQGWTDSKADFDRLQDLLGKVPCITAINVNRFEDAPPPANSPLRPQPGSGCGPGLKQCGDVCIPENDACSDRVKSGTD